LVAADPIEAFGRNDLEALSARVVRLANEAGAEEIRAQDCAVLVSFNGLKA
jgi:hypothetical protein